MKRFHLFGGDRHYPLGGWSDHRGSYDTLKEAIEKGREFRREEPGRWWHVVDMESGARCVDHYDDD